MFFEKFVYEILLFVCCDWFKDNLVLLKVVLWIGLGIVIGGLGLVVGVVVGLYNLKGVFLEVVGRVYVWGMIKFKKVIKEDIKEVLKKVKFYLVKKKEGYFEENDDYCIF